SCNRHPQNDHNNGFHGIRHAPHSSAPAAAGWNYFLKKKACKLHASIREFPVSLETKNPSSNGLLQPGTVVDRIGCRRLALREGSQTNTDVVRREPRLRR